MTVFFEATMLAAFSVGWHISVWKMLSTGRASGKSLFSVLVVCAGYACGVASKLLIADDTGVLPPVTLLYAWNFAIIACDAWLVRYYGEVAGNRRGELAWLSRIQHFFGAPAGVDDRSARKGRTICALPRTFAQRRRPTQFGLTLARQKPVRDGV